MPTVLHSDAILTLTVSYKAFSLSVLFPGVLLLNVGGLASAASQPVVLSPLPSCPVVYPLVFLRWFPAGGQRRKVSVCTWVHQCLLLGIRAGTYEPWGHLFLALAVAVLIDVVEGCNQDDLQESLQES